MRGGGKTGSSLHRKKTFSGDVYILTKNSEKKKRVAKKIVIMKLS